MGYLALKRMQKLIQGARSDLSGTFTDELGNGTRRRTTTGAVDRIRRRDTARDVRDVDFEIRDFNLAYVARQRNKLRLKWTGPFCVVDTINTAVYVCENIVTGKRTAVHKSRLCKYADSLLNVTANLKDQVVHDCLEILPR